MGDMAVSNSIGSNVFDILVGLGLPWALKTLAINYGSDVSSTKLIDPLIMVVHRALQTLQTFIRKSAKSVVFLLSTEHFINNMWNKQPVCCSFCTVVGP